MHFNEGLCFPRHIFYHLLFAQPSLAGTVICIRFYFLCSEHNWIYFECQGIKLEKPNHLYNTLPYCIWLSISFIFVILGWHLCSNCERNASYMCYTCTFSLCKGCIKDTVILCVRGNKGFCETCMRTVMLIEQNEQGNNVVKLPSQSLFLVVWKLLF